MDFHYLMDGINLPNDSFLSVLNLPITDTYKNPPSRIFRSSKVFLLYRYIAYESMDFLSTSYTINHKARTHDLR